MPTGTPETTSRFSLQFAGVAADLAASRLTGDPRTVIHGVKYDSRKIGEGDLFVALAGGYYDGHDFAHEAKERGAAALLIDRPLPVDLPQIVVPDTRAALAVVAAAYYEHPSHEIQVIGITGTDGKTTTSYLTEAILSQAGFRTGMIGTVGVRIGERVLDGETRQTTPESLDVQRHLRTMCDSGVTHAIVEATSHGLDLHRLDETRFATGAVTNVTHEHLEHHGTREAYLRAKGILFERVGEIEGNAVVNLDDTGAREMIRYAAGARVLSYGADNQDAELSATDIELGSGQTRYVLRYRNQRVPIRTWLIGRFNVENTLCAIGVALSHDISLETCQIALTQTIRIPGRMESVQRGQPFSVVVDYAHTPESIEKVLTLLRGLSSGRLILVMGSAGERDREKRPLQGAVAAKLGDYSIFTTEDPRFEAADAIIAEIAKGAEKAGGVSGIDFQCIVDRREAIEHAFSFARRGDCVLLAGKGHEQSIIWGLEKRPWDEAAVAAEILASLGYTEERL